MKIRFCVLVAFFILCLFPQLTVSAKESIENTDDKCMAEVIKKYEILSEDYCTTELTDEEFIQQYEGKVSIEVVPITDNKTYAKASCIIDGNIYDNAKCSIILKRITIENNDENSLYVLSAEAKTSQNSIEKNGVTLSGTIYWVDHLGTNNVLMNVTGVRYGSWTGNGTYAYGGKYQVLKRGTFSASGFNDQDYWGSESSSFYLSISTNTASGNSVSLTVDTSIFD